MDTQKGDVSPALEKVDEGRRKFIRRVAAGTAFAIPMVASFSTDGLSFNKAEAAFFGRTGNQTKGGGFLSRLIFFFARLLGFGGMKSF